MELVPARPLPPAEESAAALDLVLQAGYRVRLGRALTVRPSASCSTCWKGADDSRARPHLGVHAPVDMRRAFDGLALSVRERLQRDPRASELFVFVNRRANRCKIVWFDDTGACLLYKRLHRALLRLPTGAADLATLLEGVPVPAAARHPRGRGPGRRGLATR